MTRSPRVRSLAASIGVVAALGSGALVPAVLGSPAWAESGASVKVAADCTYTPEGETSVVYSLTAENSSQNDLTDVESVITWNGEGTLEQSSVPDTFPGKESVKGVVTAPARTTTAKPDNGPALNWEIDGKDHAVPLATFTKTCPSDPLPTSGSSAVAVAIVTMAIPVAIGGVALLVIRRRRNV